MMLVRSLHSPRRSDGRCRDWQSDHGYGIAIYRIVNGKIQEEWDYRDVLGLMQQLGIGPLQGQG